MDAAVAVACCLFTWLDPSETGCSIPRARALCLYIALQIHRPTNQQERKRKHVFNMFRPRQPFQDPSTFFGHMKWRIVYGKTFFPLKMENISRLKKLSMFFQSVYSIFSIEFAKKFDRNKLDFSWKLKSKKQGPLNSLINCTAIMHPKFPKRAKWWWWWCGVD